MSAAAWEVDVLRRRIGRYAPELLDQLCISGAVVWGRLSPHPAFEDERGRNGRRVRPTRSAPIALFLREDAGWLLEAATKRALAATLEYPGLSASARQVLDSLTQRGASFLADIVRETRQLTSAVEDALWELSAAGLVTADGFENLRAPSSHTSPPSRSIRQAARFVPGRWALLRRPDLLRLSPQPRPFCDVLETLPPAPARWALSSAICWCGRRSRRRGATC